MSLEWRARGNPGRRLRVYSDEATLCFDKESGSAHYRLRRGLVIYDDWSEGVRQNLVFEEAILVEDERRVYIIMRGRRVITREALPTSSTVRYRRVAEGRVIPVEQ